MNIRLSQSEISLGKRQTLSLADAAGVRIDARAGTVWVTQDHDRRDIVLRPGESFTLDGKGQAIVQAFEPARIRLTPARAASPRGVHRAGWVEWLRAAIDRVLPRPAVA